MAEDVAEVKLGADTGDATAGVAAAAASIDASMNRIAATLNAFNNKHKDMVDKAIRNNATLSRTFLELKASASGGFDGVIGVIERFKGVWASLTTVLAGGLLWRASIREMLAMEDSVRALQITFGMMSEKATTTAIAMGILGKSGQDLAQIGMKVARQIKMDEGAINDLGVTTRNAKGELLPLDVIMQNGFRTMQTYRAGVDQDEFALRFFGRTVGDVVEIMLRWPAAQQRAIELQKQLGIEMGPERQADIENYRIEVGAFTETLGLIEEKIGEHALPSLERLAAYFNEVGPNAAVKFIGYVTKVLAAMDVLATGVEEDAIRVGMFFDKLKANETSYWASMDALEKDGQAASDAVWNKGMKEKQRIELEGNAKILGLEHDLYMRMALLAEDGIGKVKAIWKSGYDLMGESDSPLGHGPRKMPVSGKTGVEDTGWMENELKAFQNQYNNKMMAQGSWQTWSETQTRDYWEEILVMDNLSAKQREEAENHYYDAQRRVQQEAFAANIAHLRAEEAEAGKDIEKKIALAQQEYDDTLQRFGKIDAKTDEAYKHLAELRNQLKEKREKAADEEAKKELELVKLQVTGEEEILKQRVALKQISVQQEVAQELVLQQRIYQAQLDGFAIREAAAQNDEDKLEAIAKERVAAEQKNQDAMTKLEMKGEQDRMQYAVQATDTIDNALTTMMDNFAMNTQKASKTWQDFVKQLTSGLTSIAAKQVGQQLFGPSTQAGGMINSLTSKLFGGAAGAAGGTAQATAEAANTLSVDALTVSTNALTLALTANTAAISAQAATSAFSATQGGGIQALFSGGSNFLASLGIGSHESGTPYVPQTSLAIVHRGERIVPASQNQSYAFGGTRNNFMINGPIDTRTMAQISRQSAKAANRARRQG